MNNKSNDLIIDKNSISCDIIIKDDSNNDKIIRKKLIEMSETDMSCPTTFITIISIILTVIFIAVICVSILIILKCSHSTHFQRRQSSKYSKTTERRNIGELIIPQKIDKQDFENYIAEQQLSQQQVHDFNHQMMFQPVNMAVNQNQFNDQQLFLSNDQQQQFPHNSHHNYPHSNSSLKNWKADFMSAQHSHSSQFSNSTTQISSPSSLRHVRPTKNSNFKAYNTYNDTSPTQYDDDCVGVGRIEDRITPDDDNNMNEDEEDHYENFDSNFLSTLNHNKKIAQSKMSGKPNIVYV
jgi:MFS superfamily sulfate permease-like transporter